VRVATGLFFNSRFVRYVRLFPLRNMSLLAFGLTFSALGASAEMMRLVALRIGDTLNVRRGPNAFLAIWAIWRSTRWSRSRSIASSSFSTLIWAAGRTAGLSRGLQVPVGRRHPTLRLVSSGKHLVATSKRPMQSGQCRDGHAA